MHSWYPHMHNLWYLPMHWTSPNDTPRLIMISSNALVISPDALNTPNALRSTHDVSPMHWRSPTPRDMIICDPSQIFLRDVFLVVYEKPLSNRWPEITNKYRSRTYSFFIPNQVVLRGVSIWKRKINHKRIAMGHRSSLYVVMSRQ